MRTTTWLLPHSSNSKALNVFLLPQSSVSTHSTVPGYVAVLRFFFNTACATGGVKTVAQI